MITEGVNHAGSFGYMLILCVRNDGFPFCLAESDNRSDIRHLFRLILKTATKCLQFGTMIGAVSRSKLNVRKRPFTQDISLLYRMRLMH